MLTQKRPTGFESIDIAQDLEETFGIAFSDLELENALTVGQVYDLIIEKIPFQKSTRSSKVEIFHHLRNDLGVPDLKPSARLSSILPIEFRKVQKHRLYEKLPEVSYFLRHPQWVYWVIPTLMIAVFVVTWPRIWLGIPCSIALGIFLDRALRRFCIIEPKSSVRDIVNIRTEFEFLTRAKATKSYNPREVWEILLTTISRYLDTRKIKVNRDSRFVEDLGLSE